jgi:hypothetical protein
MAIRIKWSLQSTIPETYLIGRPCNSELLETRAFLLHLIVGYPWNQQFGCFWHIGGVY